MTDQTNAEVSDERLREIIERLARSFAVAYVDGRHGYTMEFAPSPAAHRDEYDEAESYSRIVLETEFRMDKPMAADLNRRSVTSQASEGEVAWPEWATDKHIAEGILAEAETIVQLIIHGHEEQIAEHTGAIKSYAGTLLSRENHRHKYASPVSKRVERLETALRGYQAAVANCLTEGVVVMNDLGMPRSWWDEIIRAQQQGAKALQGGRS